MAGRRTTQKSGAIRRTAVAIFLRLPAGTRRTVLDALGRHAPWDERFDFTPPPLEDGEVAGAPDFVGIGVQKAGTTWWYDLIASHPGVFSRPGLHKERHFFDRFAALPFGPDDAADYRSWFPRPPGRVTGEWTPDYLSMPWAPVLLAGAAPETKLLVLLRDPVERMQSGLAHQLASGKRLSPEVTTDAVNRGFYHETLSRWMQHFEPGSFLLLQYERCVVDPRGELARTYEFLGLEPFEPDGVERVVNETRQPVGLHPATRRRLAELYADDVLALAAKYEGLDLDLTLWPNFTSLSER